MAPKSTAASQEEMEAARLPLGYRDLCAGLLIPLNKCRQQTLYAPWKCSHERHSYEKCEYELFLKRLKKVDQARKEVEAKQPAPL